LPKRRASWAREIESDLLELAEMAQKNQILKANKILPMSKETKERLAIVAKKIQGKELFPEKVALAKKTLSGLKSIPG
jgi:hypothetical protein